jgi:hypothetical protein
MVGQDRNQCAASVGANVYEGQRQSAIAAHPARGDGTNGDIAAAGQRQPEHRRVEVELPQVLYRAEQHQRPAQEQDGRRQDRPGTGAFDHLANQYLSTAHGEQQRRRRQGESRSRPFELGHDVLEQGAKNISAAQACLAHEAAQQHRRQCRPVISPVHCG